MTAETEPAPRPDTDSDHPSLSAVPAPLLTEAEVQSLTAIIHDVSGSSPAETNHWELETMAPLNVVSAAAIARLRAYTPPPFPLWDRLPVSRRAAVLLLLYADRQGDLRVVLTMRAANMRTFSGHAAFPGGKAESAAETPYQIARREAWEEIGLPIDDEKIPHPFKIEFLCHLPHNLARTSLAVRPCVALLHTPPPPGPADPAAADRQPSVGSMIPRLDPREVAAVFSGPFANFLAAADAGHDRSALPPGHWYDGRWITFQNHPWRVHNFYVPVNNQRVARPRPEERRGEEGELADRLEEKEKEGEGRGGDGVEAGRYKVWGMTAKILVDAAVVAYGRRPEFEHNERAGDEEIIIAAEADGEFFDKAKAAGAGANTGEPAKM
ncbi:related to coenzyme A diphosphatase [Cephalotrichum gorgonifer]|uniref:Related to coenzyme A diphosphatase n=1 Tax=Cephalotrichum gorgonifer TaxID=2041049 RepID=A0AAE8SUG2_9PEZI|nr:related to coenzyme A diphosphatase [Cephalotrichum gorgonifer]